MADDDLWISMIEQHPRYTKEEDIATITTTHRPVQYGKLLVRPFGQNVTLAYEQLIDKIDIGSPTAINSGEY